MMTNDDMLMMALCMAAHADAREAVTCVACKQKPRVDGHKLCLACLLEENERLRTALRDLKAQLREMAEVL